MHRDLADEWSFVGADLQAGTLVGVLTDFVARDGAVYAVYPHSRHLSPKVRAFVDFLAERFGPRPYWDMIE
ncbi:MAG: LysR substrate-binding domain-containing protein [Rhodospirillaceae bacterium]